MGKNTRQIFKAVWPATQVKLLNSKFSKTLPQKKVRWKCLQGWETEEIECSMDIYEIVKKISIL